MSETRWKDLTQAANAAFERGNHAIADRYYVDALDLAKGRFHAAQVRRAGATVEEEDFGCLSMLAVSAANLAENDRCSGNDEAARCALLGAFEQLMRALDHRGWSAGFAAAALKHAGELVFELMQVLRSAGNDEETIAAVVGPALAELRAASAFQGRRAAH
ncbi:MAG: hypothetical protein AAGE01_23730 [Pseudomonadota bacterium]